MTQICQTKDCGKPVSKAGYKLCLDCWKKERNAKAGGKSSPGKKSAATGMLNSTTVAEHFGIKAVRLNAILSELGWIARAEKGWLASGLGLALQARQEKFSKTGIPYVKWPPDILENNVLREEVANYLGENTAPARRQKSADASGGAASADDFRKKFPADIRATDGHLVRSKGELVIDNFLYTNSIVHAYERKLPVEENVLCDFYLPTGRVSTGGGVYIEYWGLTDPGYEANKQRKLAVYRRHNLSLIELTDKEVSNLDDHLPRLLLEYKIVVD